MARVSSVLSALTVVSASPLVRPPLGRLVNLATCNCLTKLADWGNLVPLPCGEDPRAQDFWIDPDATVNFDVHHEQHTVMKNGEQAEYELEWYHQSWLELYHEKREDLLIKVDATPETAEYIHLINSWAGEQWVVKEGVDEHNRTYYPAAMDDDDQAQRFVFVCETCARHVLPCQPPAPTPPAPTPPTPSPGGHHYGGAPCQNDEIELGLSAYSIQGLSACSKTCGSTSDCPTDLPSGTSATPICQGDIFYCVLQCSSDTECGEGGSCTYQQCWYPSSGGSMVSV